MTREIKESDNFKSAYSKLDKSIIQKIDKILVKIINNPEIGKPMKYTRKGTREVYVNPFRLSYAYDKSEDILYLLDLYHKKKQ
tara:strand:- start:125 stop:373 length:249 start_codon:yes stop_codon:yes gene_type:complete